MGMWGLIGISARICPPDNVYLRRWSVFEGGERWCAPLTGVRRVECGGVDTCQWPLELVQCSVVQCSVV